MTLVLTKPRARSVHFTINSSISLYSSRCASAWWTEMHKLWIFYNDSVIMYGDWYRNGDLSILSIFSVLNIDISCNWTRFVQFITLITTFFSQTVLYSAKRRVWWWISPNLAMLSLNCLDRSGWRRPRSCTAAISSASVLPQHSSSTQKPYIKHWGKNGIAHNSNA